MSKKRLSVVVTRRLPEAVETRLSELFDVTLREDDRPMTREELGAAMRQRMCWCQRSPMKSTRR